MTNLKKEPISKIIFDSSIFRIVYIMNMFLGCIACMESLSFALKFVIFSWGAIILIKNYFYKKEFLQIKYWYIFALFILSEIVTTLLHFKDNLLPNLSFVYHSMICFFLLYGLCVDTNKDKLKKEFKIFAKAFTYSTTLLGIIGLTIIIFKAQIKIGEYPIGIYNNRFIGVYTNSNLVGFCSVISIIFCHMLFKKRDSKTNKLILPNWFMFICLAINSLSLFLCDSNASFLLLIIYVAIMTFYYVFSNQNYPNKTTIAIIKRSVFILVVCLGITFLCFNMRIFFQNGISILINNVHNIESPVGDNTLVPIVDNTLTPTENNILDPNLSIGRYSEDYDISSGRITLLKQSVVMFKNNPILGIGRGNVVDYGYKYLPNGLRFSDFHNGYVTMLVSYGIVGFAIFFIFALMVLVKICKCLFTHNKIDIYTIFPNLFAFLVSYCIYSMFEKTILSELTFMVGIFWLLLGYAMAYVKDSEN